jgi:hypothetical protein
MGMTCNEQEVDENFIPNLVTQSEDKRLHGRCRRKIKLTFITLL